MGAAGRSSGRPARSGEDELVSRLVAPVGGELIGQVALAMRTNMFTGRLAQTTQAYPTWSMAIQETAAQFFMTQRGHTARDARAQE